MKSLFFFLLITLICSNLSAQNVDIDTISVDNVRKVVQMSWVVKDTSNVQGFIVFHKLYGRSQSTTGKTADEGAEVPIYVYDKDARFFRDETTDYPCWPYKAAEYYRVTTFYYANGVPKMKDIGGLHNTIFLTKVGFDKCKKQNFLRWYKYKSWEGEIANYQIFAKENSDGKYTLVGQVSESDTNFIHKGVKSNVNYYYFIQVIHKTNLHTSCSNIDSIYTESATEPNIITANSASFISEHKINVTFSIDYTSETKKFALVRSLSSGGTVDTLAHIEINQNPFIYTDSVTTPRQVYYYRLTAQNYCGYTVASSNEVPTLMLKAALQRNGSILLSWNNYSTFWTQLKNYRIFVSNTKNSGYTLLDEPASNSTLYSHKNIALQKTYYYYIQALNADNEIVKSNLDSVFVRSYTVPLYLNADGTEIQKNTTIKVSFSIDTTVVYKKYSILRSNIIDGNYESIATVETQTSPLIYNDITNSVSQVYYYQLVLLDTLNKKVASSNLAHTIVLKATNLSNGNINLTWNKYITWLGKVYQYKIYRLLENGDKKLIDTLAGTSDSGTYEDKISELTASQITSFSNDDGLRYVVEAEEYGNKYNITGNAVSNTVYITLDSSPSLPNAFNPLSTNELDKTFSPAITFAKSYFFAIYNRWGAKVFETTDYKASWNGKSSNGDYAQEGVYVYYLKYTNIRNELVEKTGYIALIFSK